MTTPLILLIPLGSVLTVSLAGCRASEGQAVDLGTYRWQNRLLLVFAPSPDHADAAEQRRMNVAETAGFRERDLLEGYLYKTTPGTLGADVVPTDDAAAIRRRFDVPAGATAVVLVGKDGGEKFRADGPVPPQRLFELIDAMPMRQEEMRAQRGE